jgi:hypothetical protein
VRRILGGGSHDSVRAFIVIIDVQVEKRSGVEPEAFFQKKNRSGCHGANPVPVSLVAWTLCADFGDRKPMSLVWQRASASGMGPGWRTGT